MKWIPLSEKLPETKGKYVVKTLTPMKNVHKFETIYHGNGKWGASNQKITHWLFEN